MEITRLPLSRLEPNKGQIEGLPQNPRTWTQTDIDKLAASLIETPELFEARPIIVVPTSNESNKYVILGGNLRYAASKKNDARNVPCYVLPLNTPIEKMKEIVLKDNSSFGDWNEMLLAEDWKDINFEQLNIYFSDKNFDTSKEIDPNEFSQDITLRLKFHEPYGSILKAVMGEDPKQSLLQALSYETK